MKDYTAILLAGDRGEDDPLLISENVQSKAFIRVNGETLIDTSLSTLKRCEAIKAIYVVGKENLEDYLPNDVNFVLQAKGPSASILKVMNKIKKGHDKNGGNANTYKPLFITTVDHRLLQATDISCFLDQSNDTDADITTAMIKQDLIFEKYPSNKRTKLRFRDGNYSACNMFTVQNAKGIALFFFWQNVEKLRKKLWRMAMKIGPLTVSLLFLRRLTLVAAMDRLGKKLDIKVEPVFVDRAELGIDIDKIEDLELVRSILSSDEKK